MVGWGFRKVVECLKMSSRQKNHRGEGQSVKKRKLTGGGGGPRGSRLSTQEQGHPFPHVESKFRSVSHLSHPGLSQLSAVGRKAPGRQVLPIPSAGSLWGPRGQQPNHLNSWVLLIHLRRLRLHTDPLLLDPSFCPSCPSRHTARGCGTTACGILGGGLWNQIA